MLILVLDFCIKMWYPCNLKRGEIMAKNRVIPFGYCMRNGEIMIDFTESKAIVKIFEEYLNGSSLLQIAKLMESERIRYSEESEHWNKNLLTVLQA